MLCAHLCKHRFPRDSKSRDRKQWKRETPLVSGVWNYFWLDWLASQSSITCCSQATSRGPRERGAGSRPVFLQRQIVWLETLRYWARSLTLISDLSFISFLVYKLKGWVWESKGWVIVVRSETRFIDIIVRGYSVKQCGRLLFKRFSLSSDAGYNMSCAIILKPINSG